jgi:DNA invertase Pin-like site-specific DNA recombinase
MVQEAGHAFLQRLGITLVSAAAPDSFLSDTPSAVLMRQMFGAISQFDRAVTVAKLKAARDRKRATGAKVEGRRNYAQSVPETVALAQRLAVEPGVAGRRRSLRDIAAALAEQGHVTSKGQPYSPASVARIIEQANGKRRRASTASQQGGGGMRGTA